MWEGPGFSSGWNLGPSRSEAETVASVVEMARQAYGQGEFVWSSKEEGPIESRWLTLDTTKAERELGISTRWSIREAVGCTMQWYRREAEGVSAVALCCQDIDNYMSL
jgi:CDP-glucose 4,6-dehydratase